MVTFKSKGLYDPLTKRGNRKLNAGDITARRLVREYKGLDEGVTPIQVYTALQKAAPAMGLSKNAQIVVNYLWSLLSPKIDFLAGQYAIVWPRNSTVMIETGISDEKSLKRAYRELRQNALIAYKDAPNKQRRGRRDPKTKMIILEDTFGIILTPIAAQYKKLLKITDEYVLVQKYKRRLRLNFNAYKREAEELLNHAYSILPSSDFESASNKIFDTIRSYGDTGRDFKAKEVIINRLRKCLDTLSEVLMDFNDHNPSSDNSGIDVDLEYIKSYLNENPRLRGQITPSIIPITRPFSNSSNRLGDAEVRRKDRKSPEPHKPNSSWDEKFKEIRQSTTIKEKYLPKVPSYDQVEASLPPHIRNKTRKDHGFYELYDLICEYSSQVGIERIVLSQARAIMGIENVCACMAVIFEKHNTLNRPDNYLRSLSQRHRTGNLYISRSLFGIIDRRSKGNAHDQMDLHLA